MKITQTQINQLSIDKGFSPSVFSDMTVCATVESLHDFARALIAMAQEVPNLKWFDFGGGWRSAGGIDEYRITPSGFNFSVWVSHPDCDGAFVAREVNGLDEAKAAANEHNRQLILSQLKYEGEK